MSIHAETYRKLAQDPAYREALLAQASLLRVKAEAMQAMMAGLRIASETFAGMTTYFQGEVPAVLAEVEAIEHALREVAQ